MIESFFQSLERHSVEYLLISGQATVLYGAATFSEDVDLWVKPSRYVSSRVTCQSASVAPSKRETGVWSPTSSATFSVGGENGSGFSRSGSSYSAGLNVGKIQAPTVKLSSSSGPGAKGPAPVPYSRPSSLVSGLR